MFQKCVSTGVEIATVATAVTTSVFGSVNLEDGWSAAGLLSLQSYGLRLSLFVWTTNSTKLDEYSAEQDSFENNFSTINVLLAVISITMKCFGLIMDNAANDIMLFAAVTMTILKTEFENQLAQRESNYENNLYRYKSVQNVSTRLEDAMAVFFKICHTSNLL